MNTNTQTAAFSAVPWDRQAMMVRSSQRAPKARPSSSCIPCRTRKVKCNRLDPCETCISRGVANECKYSANDEDRQSIAQADVIDDLRSTVKGLKGKLSQVEQERQFERRHTTSTSSSPSASSTSTAPSAGGHDPHDESRQQQNDDGSSAMEIVYTALQSGSPDVVQNLVALIRNGAPMEEVACLAEQYIASAPS